MEDSDDDEVPDYSVFDTDEEEDAELARLEAFIAEDDGLGELFPVPSTSVPTKHQSPTLPSTSDDEDALELEKIESALGLNKLLSEKLKELENVLVGRLRECRERLSDLHKAVTSEEKSVRPETFRYVNCGKPYFRDESNFPAPPNEDTIIMAKSKMYDFSEIAPVAGWTVKEKKSLSRLLLKMSIKIRKRRLTSKIAQLKREGKDKNPKKLEKEIDAVIKEIMALSKKTLKEIALPIEEEHEYDWDLVASTLNKRHNATEYRALWKVYMHPDLNKSVWSKSETALLHEIATKYEFQDWEAIAKELNTGRSGYQCFVYYRTNISNTCTGKKWTKEEEEYLRRLILYYKQDDYIPWGKVASAMENRTKVQIYNKYVRLLEKRKGRFIPEEDAVILACFDKFGLNFKKMAEYLPGRSAAQIRVHYRVLAKKRTSAVWTIEEDKLLLQTMANEDTDINYSTVSKHFPGKTRTQTRTRYLTLIRWMKAHPNCSVENAPRRAARCLSRGLPTENLNSAIEKLRKRVELDLEIRKLKSNIYKASVEDIDDKILSFLTTEQGKDEEIKRAEIENEEEMVFLNDVELPAAQSLNIANFQNLIAFLKGNLNQDFIAKSSFAEEYPELLKSKPKVNCDRIKSYSRKSPKTAEKLDGAPDMWWNKISDPLTCVLPPNIATITGCMRVMSYLRSKEIKVGAPPLNIEQLMRNNPDIKSQKFLLQERLNTLFMFPMLLANVDPEQLGKMLPKEISNAECLKMTESETKSGDSNINSLGFLIPQIPKVQAETGYNTTTIDLEEPSPQQKRETCLPNIVIGENVIFVEQKKSKHKKRRLKNKPCVMNKE